MVKEGFRNRGARATKGLKERRQKSLQKSQHIGTSLMVQRLRICLPVQGCGFNPWGGTKTPHALQGN